MPLVLFNIGWMRRYRGQTETDRIVNGGQYVQDNETGSEIRNFLPAGEHLYGYVQPPGDGDKSGASGRSRRCGSYGRRDDRLHGDAARRRACRGGMVSERSSVARPATVRRPHLFCEGFGRGLHVAGSRGASPAGAERRSSIRYVGDGSEQRSLCGSTGRAAGIHQNSAPVHGESRGLGGGCRRWRSAAAAGSGSAGKS